jgi:hypothetical protein
MKSSIPSQSIKKTYLIVLSHPVVMKRFGFANAQFQYNKRGRKQKE